MVSQVTGLNKLRGFGFSLDGKVDVDDNGYRGTYTSDVMHIFHSHSQIWLLVQLVISQDKLFLY